MIESEIEERREYFFNIRFQELEIEEAHTLVLGFSITGLYTLIKLSH